MRVMLLIPDLTQGGAERQAVTLANGLAERGHEVSLALFRKKGAFLDLVGESVTVHGLAKGGQADVVGFLVRLRSLVRRERPDVIYSFLGVPNLSALALRASGVGVPVVWGIRASDVDLSKYGWMSRACHAMERRLAPFADRIIINSEAGRRHVAAQGYPAHSMMVVGNGIDVDAFRPNRESGRPLRREWGIPDSTVLVGVVGRLAPMKGHDMLIRAAAIALRSASNLRFVCAGEGGFRESLESMAGESGVSGHMVWAGSRSDMPAVYNALDLLCLPSVSEGFPNVLGEAMACGVPCVTTDVGDAARIVGDTGLVVPSGDVDALGAALVKMADAVTRGNAPETRQRVVANFSVDVMVRKTEEILTAVVAGRG